jgi:hypothetical protein
MNKAAPKCSKCFATGIEVAQFEFASQTEALGLYALLIRQRRLPFLCQMSDRKFHVCHETEKNSSGAVAMRGRFVAA